MGMVNDEAKSIYEYVLVNLYRNNTMTEDSAIEILSQMMSRERNIAKPEEKEAGSVVIQSTRKYQKIVQIIEDWKRDKGLALEMSELYWLDRVKEVIEDEAD